MVNAPLPLEFFRLMSTFFNSFGHLQECNDEIFDNDWEEAATFPGQSMHKQQSKEDATAAASCQPKHPLLHAD